MLKCCHFKMCFYLSLTLEDPALLRRVFLWSTETSRKPFVFISSQVLRLFGEGLTVYFSALLTW